MLNLTDIAQRIEQPERSSVADIAALQELCTTYPYSQVFPLLYLKALAANNDIRLDQEVQRYAYRISDRSILFTLLHESVGQAPEAIAEEVAETPVQTDELENTASVVVEETIPSDTPEESTVFEEEIAADEATESLVASIEQVPDELPANTTVEPVADAFSDELTAHTLAAGYSIEREEEKRLAEERERLIQALKQDQELPAEEEMEASVESPVEPEVVAPEEEPEASSFTTPVSIDSKRSFSSWLRANDPQEFAESTEAADNADASTRSNVSDLIDRFIAGDAKISAPEEKLFEDRKEKKEFFSPTKKAKESLDEGHLPVSETLAKIFTAQGNYPKAIYAYEQLMLIIPEKKIFFANQIKELQKKINPE